MKIEPRLPPLPSLGELLEHPRVKVLVERINRSTLAHRASGFLDEIRESIVARAGRVEVPSVSHLAERLVHRLLGEPPNDGPVINATGVVLGSAAIAPPLAEAAVHAILQSAGEFHRQDVATVRLVERRASDVAGSAAARVVSSFEGAVAIAASALASKRELQTYGAANGAGAIGAIDWPRLALESGVVLSTPPSTLRQPDEVQSPRPRETAAVIVRCADDPVDLKQLAGSKPRDAKLIDVAAIAGIINPCDHGYQSIETIRDRLAAGADLVIVDGAGLFGGPACGLIFGNRQLVDQIASCSMMAAAPPDPLTVAALDAVLGLYRDAASTLEFQLPVWQLLSAPLANLEQRANRLAALIAATPGIASAAACSAESAWLVWAGRTWTAPTWVIEVRPQSDPGSFAESLLKGRRPLITSRAKDVTQIDMRTVFPRWDEAIVEDVEIALRGRRPATSE